MKKWLVGISGMLLFIGVAGCNIRGFFVRYEDDPVFHGPSEEPTQQASGQTAGTIAAGDSKGAGVYRQICASCHQQNGQGIAGVYPPLAGSEFLQGDPTISIRIVLHGFQGRIERQGKVYNGVMSGWGTVLSDEDIAAVLSYARSAWGNSAPPITAEQVREVRQKTQGRSQPYTEAELKQPL
ncbi:MAG: c-type cytochrome [Candidatus Kapabacteria bacterium]|nr:c-type cytochrome [Candidatus Kapabacteria bacterium]MDW8012370.1 c-type cytochrome [Bacteroidota bacterium]